jgi:hypothetical protein
VFLGAASAVLVCVGLLAALVPAGGRATLRRRDQAARRRLAGTTVTLGALLAAGAVLVQMNGQEAQGLAASLVMLGIVVGAQLLSASAVTEVALLGGAVATLGTLLDYVEPASIDDPAYWFAEPPVRAWDVVVPAAFVLLGLLWATVGARLLSLPVLAQALGLVVAFTAALGAMTDRRMQWGWFAVLVAFALLGLLVHVRTHAWPWLVLCIASLTVTVFFLVAQSTNPALGLLVAGLVLLAASGSAVGLSRRAERRARLEPTAERASQVG